MRKDRNEKTPKQPIKSLLESVSVLLTGRFFFRRTPLARFLIYGSIILYFLLFVETSAVMGSAKVFLFVCWVLLTLLTAFVQFLWNVYFIVAPVVVEVIALFFAWKARKSIRKRYRAIKVHIGVLLKRIAKNVCYMTAPIVLVMFVGVVLHLTRGYREQLAEQTRNCDARRSIVNVKAATVAVVNNPSFYDLDPNHELGHGTGILISKNGYILTAAHVISEVNGDQNVSVMFPDGGVLPASGVVYDDQADVAVLKIDGDSYPSVHLSSASGSTLLFEPLYALGIPNHLSKFEMKMSIVDRLFSYTSSGIQELETLGKVEHGYSGGPIFDVCGNIIGISINTRRVPLSSSNQVEIMTTAVSSETIRKLIKKTVELD